MATAERVLELARVELGTKEIPANSNRVKYNTWYYGREVSGTVYPWCMTFVQWIFSQAGVSLPVKTASCGALMNAAKRSGQWVTKGFRPGDVVIYDFPGGADTDHTGIVETVLAAGVAAIEGNTSQTGSQSNGGEVCRKDRPWKYVVGAVRPQFAAEPEKPEEDEEMDVKRFTELWREMRRELQDNDSGSYSQEARTWAVDSQLLQGSGTLADGTPNYMWEDVLTREQLVTVLYRFAKKAGLA